MGTAVPSGGKGRKRRGAGRPLGNQRLIVRGVPKEHPDWDGYVSILLAQGLTQAGIETSPEEIALAQEWAVEEMTPKQQAAHWAERERANRALDVAWRRDWQRKWRRMPRKGLGIHLRDELLSVLRQVGEQKLDDPEP